MAQQKSRFIKGKEVIGTHWTSEPEALAYAIAAELTGVVERRADKLKISLYDIANALGKTATHVQNLIHRPNDPSLRELVQLAKSVGFKVALVVYDEDNSEDETVAPVNGKIMEQCWRALGSPRDFFELEKILERQRKDEEQDE